MNIFGVGLPEMGIIAVVALLIFGPDRLPEVMGQAGKLMKDFRRMTSDLTGEFEKTIAEAKDIGSSVTKDLGGMTKEVNSVTNSLKRDLNKSTTTAKSTSSSTAKKATGTGAKSSTAAKAGTTSKSTSSTASSFTSKTAVVASTPKASKVDPIVDVSLFEPAPLERKNRARRAVPSAIADPSPRSHSLFDDADAEATDARTHGDELAVVASTTASDDAIRRARERRRAAGYARQSA